MSNEQSSSLEVSIPDLVSLERIFEAHGWKNNYYFSDSAKPVFDMCSELLARLNHSQKQLFFELLRKYDHVTDYTTECRQLAAQLKLKLNPARQYFVLPCEGNDGGFIKSGHSVCYELKSFFRQSEYPNVDFLDSAASGKIQFGQHYSHVIVDDFIGSGSQAQTFLSGLINRGLVPDQTHVLAICMLSEGSSNLRRSNFNLIANRTRPKAFADSYAIGAMRHDEALECYLSIEAMVRIKNKYSLGFSKSEALVTMKRTPNNTLPIFWSDKLRGGGKWPAPFPRT